MSPFFGLDPLFRRTFLLVVPCRAFGKITSSGLFASVEIYTTLAKILSQKSDITKEEVICVFLCVCVSTHGMPARVLLVRTGWKMGQLLCFFPCVVCSLSELPSPRNGGQSIHKENMLTELGEIVRGSSTRNIEVDWKTLCTNK